MTFHRLTFLVALLVLHSLALAQEETMFPPSVEGAHKAKVHDPNPHPEIPEDAEWTRVVLLLIGGLFAAAIPIGIIVRSNMPEEVPAAHDDHGAGHDDHGHGGHGAHDSHGHAPAAGHH